eukprot:75493-Ditylum_brightwellii.AAC.1
MMQGKERMRCHRNHQMDERPWPNTSSPQQPSQAAVMLAIEKGPHMSVMTPDSMKVVHEDVQYQ